MYKIKVDLGIRHDTRCEKYHKRSDKNGEAVGVQLSLEFCTAGKGSQPIRKKSEIYTHTHTHTHGSLYKHINTPV